VFLCKIEFVNIEDHTKTATLLLIALAGFQDNTAPQQ